MRAGRHAALQQRLRARRGELPESLEPRMAAAWARVSPALSRAVHAMRELEAENGKLKKLLAEAHLDIHALKGVFGVKR